MYPSSNTYPSPTFYPSAVPPGPALNPRLLSASVTAEVHGGSIVVSAVFGGAISTNVYGGTVTSADTLYGGTINTITYGGTIE